MNYGIAGIVDHGIKQIGKPYVGLIKEMAKKYGLPEVLISHQMYRESSFDPTVVSPKGAVGIMQIMPERARLIGRLHDLPYTPLTDPYINADLGCAFMRDLFNEAYKHVKSKQAAYELALVGYFAGPGRMRAVINGDSMTTAEATYVNNVIWDYSDDQSWADLKTQAPADKGGWSALFSLPLWLAAAIAYYAYKKKK